MFSMTNDAANAVQGLNAPDNEKGADREPRALNESPPQDFYGYSLDNGIEQPCEDYPWSESELEDLEPAPSSGMSGGKLFDCEAEIAKVDAKHGIKARPSIQIRAGELHDAATFAEQALRAADTPFYARGDELVRPVIMEVPASSGRNVKAPSLIAVTEPMMIDHLSRAAEFFKFDARLTSLKPIDPPKAVAATVISRAGEWAFPHLAGIVTSPILRPDGSILSNPGYDPATQLLLVDPPAMPDIPEAPTRGNAAQALALLNSLLSEFPFVDNPSRSVALSGLITPVVRAAMPVAPLHAAGAPVAGSGKTFLWDCAAAIATGDRAPVFAAGRTEEETEKRLNSALLAGRAVVMIDNVNGELGGDFVCQAIERPLLSVRALGASRIYQIANKATLFATGNNIALAGDMTRRVLLASLDPKDERPELRPFNGNPLTRILADRGRYVAAALTVVRAYLVAGCPDMCSPLASFEDWSRLVRSALVWLGEADPCDTMEAARDGDPVLGQLGQLLSAWHGAAGVAKKTASGIEQLAPLRDDNPLRVALMEVAENRRGDGVDTRRLGQYLKRHKGRIVNGFRLASETDAHSKQQVWQIEVCG